MTGYDRDKAMARGRHMLTQQCRLLEAIGQGQASEARKVLDDHLKSSPDFTIQ